MTQGKLRQPWGEMEMRWAEGPQKEPPSGGNEGQNHEQRNIRLDNVSSSESRNNTKEQPPKKTPPTRKVHMEATSIDNGQTNG